MSDNNPEISSRLTTSPMLDAVPSALRVTWIAWDSSFRATDLRVGDRITAVNGKPVPPKSDSQAVGQYAESQAWTAVDALKLTAQRRNLGGTGWQTIEITGKLVPKPNYTTKDGRMAVAPGGPDSMTNDGFADSWGSWYEDKIVPKFTQLLDGAWQVTSFNSRFEWKMHQQLKPQIDYLVQHYPGNFARSVKADWQSISDSLFGAKVDLTPEDLKYRRAEEEKIQHVREASQAAFTAFQAAVAADTIPTFPALDPTQADRQTVTGKYVVLPQIRSSDWMDNGGNTFFAFGNENDGFYFAEEEVPDAQAMLLAAERYERLVTTSLEATYTVIGRITNQPALKVVNGRGVYGMVIEMAGVLVGDAMFVDLTQRKDTIAPFTAEAEVDQPMHALPPPDATPAQVMETLFGAMKLGDAKLWKALFADWRVVMLDDGRAMLYLHEDGVPDQYWEYSKQSLASRVYGLRLAWISDPYPLTTGKEFDGAPLIEQTDAEIDHIGLFDGEYHVFKDTTINRVWQLQRINGGPWRITSQQPL